jgi:membrane protein YqaA with SNARE-associated domain
MEFEVGYWGLFFASFLAATVIPFSSEAILSAIIIAGYNPVYSLIIATSGNWLGGLTNYAIGYMGKLEWIHKYLRIPSSKLDKVKSFLIGKELWISTFCWLPFVGDIMAVALGLIRANFWLTATGMLIGKAARYIVWAYLTLEVQSYFF